MNQDFIIKGKNPRAKIYIPNLSLLLKVLPKISNSWPQTKPIKIIVLCVSYVLSCLKVENKYF